MRPESFHLQQGVRESARTAKPYGNCPQPVNPLPTPRVCNEPTSYGGFQQLEALFRSPHNEDHDILGPTVGASYCWKPPYQPFTYSLYQPEKT